MSVSEPRSLLDRLRDQHAQSVDATIDIPVPEYRAPELVARYRFLSSGEAKKIGQRIQRDYRDDFDRLLYGTIDQLIAACEGLYARDGDELVPVDPDGDGPARYDERCAAFFGLDASKGRDVVRAVFKDNDYAIVDHGGLLQRWLSDRTIEANAAVGER